MTEQYLQVVTGGKAREEMAQGALNMLDAFVINDEIFVSQPPTLNTEAWAQYSPDLLPKLEELRAKCVMGDITVDEFFAKYDSYRSAGIDEINRQAQAAWDSLTK